MIILGALFLLDNMEVIEFGYLANRLWPVLLIIWGINLILKKRGNSLPEHESRSGSVGGIVGDRDTSTGADRISYSSIFGDFKVRLASREFRGGTASTVFGDSVLDMTSVSLAEGEHVLTVSGVFGDARITLSKEIPFSLRCSTVLGAVECNEQRQDGFSASLKYESTDYASATKRLRIEATQVFGDVRVSQ